MAQIILTYLNSLLLLLFSESKFLLTLKHAKNLLILSLLSTQGNRALKTLAVYYQRMDTTWRNLTIVFTMTVCKFTFGALPSFFGTSWGRRRLHPFVVDFLGFNLLLAYFSLFGFIFLRTLRTVFIMVLELKAIGLLLRNVVRKLLAGITVGS